MRYLIISSILTFCALTVSAQESFYYSINSTLPSNKKVTKVYVSYEIAGIKFKDSLDLDQKQLTLKKTLSQPVSGSIYTNSIDIEPLSVMLANNNLSVAITGESISIGKEELQDDFLYLTENDRIRPRYFPLYGELSAKNDTIGLKKLGVIFDSLKNADIKKSYEFFKSNTTSLLSLFSFNRYTTFFADYSKVEDDFALLPTWAKDSPDGKNIMAKIEGAKSVQLNTQAKKFIQQSSTGKNISLDEFQGKYVLLDFWASWCAPCRKEHPNLIKIYENYKDKNFEIISISLDSEYDNWTRAIAKDQIVWTQVSDLKGQQNEIAIQYGIQSVPANFLIDPKGLIIGKNLKSEALDETLKNLIDK